MQQHHNTSNDIIETAKILYQKNLLAAGDGNISVLIDDKKVLITPQGKRKASLQQDEMALLDIDGTALHNKASSETTMHLTIYQHCPKARAVIHAHAPYAVAWSIAYPDLKELPSHSLAEVILACGSIPFVPFARPGTKQMGDNLLPFLPKHRAMILSRHGVLAWGETLAEALNGVERIEHSAQMLFHAKALGQLTNLPDDEIAYLYQQKEKRGDTLL